MKTRSLTAALVALLVLAPSLARASGTVVFQVRTDMKPGVEFKEVRMRLFAGRTGTFMHERTRRASPGESWDRGIRVAEIGPLGDGEYRALVSAIDRKGKVVVERPVNFELKGRVKVITILLTPLRPRVDPCQAQFSRDKRACGLALKKCIADRTRLASCQETHDGCIKGAEARRDKCTAEKNTRRWKYLRQTP